MRSYLTKHIYVHWNEKKYIKDALNCSFLWPVTQEKPCAWLKNKRNKKHSRYLVFFVQPTRRKSNSGVKKQENRLCSWLLNLFGYPRFKNFAIQLYWLQVKQYKTESKYSIFSRVILKNGGILDVLDQEDFFLPFTLASLQVLTVQWLRFIFLKFRNHN